jgi:GNAT superfamily N-acetyltransferase
MGSRTPVVRTYLQLLQPGDLRPGREPAGAFTLLLERPCSVALYRRLYAEVGSACHWHDRDAWTDEELSTYLARDCVEVWILRQNGNRLGYVELLSGADGAVEIAYFGLVPSAQGKGFGGRLLTLGVQRAWAIGATRVWLHTCTLDGPAALPNYIARGFAAYDRETYEIDLRGTPGAAAGG